MQVLSQEVILSGTPICRGIAIGRPFYIAPQDSTIPEYEIAKDKVEAEVDRYQRAVSKGLNDLRLIQKKLKKEQIQEGAAILDGHIQMMQDSLLTVHVEGKIRQIGKNAEFIFKSVIDECQEKFETIDDSFFRERFKDLQGISKRILGHLKDCRQLNLKDIPSDSIIFAADLTAFDTAQASTKKVSAFVTLEGGSTAHAAIVAKAKGIPYVTNVDFKELNFEEVELVIVDGRTGNIIVHPTPETIKKYQQVRSQLQQHLQKLQLTSSYESETFDGYRLQLSANIEAIDEIAEMHRQGGLGVGLLRTESAYLSWERFPTEEEQFTNYCQFVKEMKGLPIVIRTFDIGGDKFLRNQVEPQSEGSQPESNPFLGCRAIRFLLRREDLFRAQLRAILRASAFGDVSLMFPMVSALSELREAKKIFREEKAKLEALNVKTGKEIKIGCMIEVPSAAIIADLLAKECDFLSIGTNDLVQYALAVDRSNSALSDLYAPTHPSVIRLIRLVVNEANHRGIPVTICGEIAADPRFTQLLIGLGVHELSVAARYLPVIKNAIRSTSVVSATKLAEQVLLLSSSEEIEKLLNTEYKRNVPEDCFYNC
jgi:phosphotransferase system enzyme I (PtsI)